MARNRREYRAHYDKLHRDLKQQNREAQGKAESLQAELEKGMKALKLTKRRMRNMQSEIGALREKVCI